MLVKAQERSGVHHSAGMEVMRLVGAGTLYALASSSLFRVGPSNSQFPDAALIALLLQGRRREE
jgi:hypothetical protein